MIPTYASLVRRFGLAFRPDFPAYAYGEHANVYASPPDREAHDAVVRTAFAEYEAHPITMNPYDAALAVWREDGLLGAGDPGPPAFRQAHEAYLAQRAKPAADYASDNVFSGTRPLASGHAEQLRSLAEPKPSEVTFTSSPTGRPRVPLAEILGAVARFRAETHPLELLGFSNPLLAMAEANAARDRLVAWFAERGVDVIP
jgi:hypothetical protein